MQKNHEQYLSIGEASEYLGVSIDTLRRWTKKAKLTAFLSPGKHRYFKRTDLDEVFGTRYERKEKLVTGDRIIKPLTVADGSDSPHLDDPSIYGMEENNFPYPETANEEVPPQAPIEEKRPLDVPRFIRSHNISKYDLLLHPRVIKPDSPKQIEPPAVLGEIKEKSEEPVKPINLGVPSYSSILTPIKITQTLQTPTVSKEQLKSRMVIEEVMEKEIKKDNSPKMDKILRSVFFGFLTLDIILFVFWFISYKINSPLP